MFTKLPLCLLMLLGGMPMECKTLRTAFVEIWIELLCYSEVPLPECMRRSHSMNDYLECIYPAPGLMKTRLMHHQEQSSRASSTSKQPQHHIWGASSMVRSCARRDFLAEVTTVYLLQ